VQQFCQPPSHDFQHKQGQAQLKESHDGNVEKEVGVWP